VELAGLENERIGPGLGLGLLLVVVHAVTLLLKVTFTLAS
jgi:hypothetical protein